MNILEPRFKLGDTFATTGVTAFAEREGADLTKFLWRHHCGIWGNLDAEDQAANEDALADGGRIFSCFVVAEQKIYIVTEHDRSKTTIMLAREY